MNTSCTICAIATSPGSSAIALIRISGPDSIFVTDKIFTPSGSKSLKETKSHSLRFGTISDPTSKTLVDEVLVSLFRAPRSYTGEDMVEISCHGSDFVVQEIMRLLLASGATLAEPGEFTKRAFIAGKMDLAQAEAVADLIASETAAAHDAAIQQMKGGFSKELSTMRKSLLDIVSLMELELDFSEEDVEFADREKLSTLLHQVIDHIEILIDSFKLGNVIKNGVPVVIIGKTNTGKSTLLNTILGDDRALVSDIHGTTRDSIEDTLNIGGVVFRFIDTAGIRHTQETVENMGIERTYSKLKTASMILLILDAERPDIFKESIELIAPYSARPIKGETTSNRHTIILLNKADNLVESSISAQNPYISTLISSIVQNCNSFNIDPLAIIPISAKYGDGIDILKSTLLDSQLHLKAVHNATLVTNIRHYEALTNALDSLQRVQKGLDTHLSTDLVSQDIREALYYIGTITGEISTDEILGNIFKNFCIGK